MRSQSRCFTLVEIMIVVAIIALLAAIVIPSFVKSRSESRKSACINNLRLIDHAKQQYATAKNLKETDTPADSDIWGYLKNGQPICPGGGSYTVGNMSTLPVCSLSADGHVLSTGTN